MNLYKLLDSKVNMVKLIDRLAFDPDELEEAAVEQPGLYLEASRWRIQQMKLRLVRAAKVERLKSKVGLAQRREKHTHRGERITEGHIKDIVELNPRLRKARIRLERAYLLEEFGKSLVETFRQREHMVRELLQSRGQEISSEIRQVKNRMAGNDIRKKARKLHDKYRDVREDEDD